jgi:hypothetical protein
MLIFSLFVVDTETMHDPDGDQLTIPVKPQGLNAD